MLKKIRNVVIALAVVTIIGIVGFLSYSSGRTYFNEESEIGNTLGNIYNGGLFCEQDGLIYFSNDAADGKLYATDSTCTEFKKIHNDKAAFINADDNYLYYVRANDTRENQKDNFMMFYNTGVFRIDKNGGKLMAFTGNPGAYLMLYGNNIFLQRYDVSAGLYLYKYQIDGEQERLLYKDAVIPAGVSGNTLYFTGNLTDHAIHGLDLSSYTSHPIYEGNIRFPIFTKNYIYYINLDDNYNIYRMGLDGSDPEPMIKDRVFTYNITNDESFLYYQVDDGKHNRICRYNLLTLEDETLMKGNYKQIHVTDNYIFFKDFNNSDTYIMRPDGDADISTFNPPDLDATPAP